jgi:peptidyl-dipeptidase Dcp
MPMLFEYFKEEGVFNTTVADKFNTYVLSQGGREDPNNTVQEI